MSQRGPYTGHPMLAALIIPDWGPILRNQCDECPLSVIRFTPFGLFYDRYTCMTLHRRPLLGDLDSPALQTLVEQALNHIDLENQVIEALPPHLRKQCRFAQYHDGSLTLVTSSSALAAQIRLYQHEILSTLREQQAIFQFAWSLKVKVALDTAPPARAVMREPISKKNAQLLEEEARHTDNQALRDVLLRLARHASRG